MLQLLYNLLPAKQRKELPEARSKLWSVPLGSNQNELEEGEIRPGVNGPLAGKYGDFERHTTGVGSKLLTKWGFGGEGSGLGRSQQGRAEPVQAVQLPKGLGLGAIKGVTKPTPAPKWVPKDGKYWADEPSPSPYVPEPTPKPSPKPMGTAEIGKVDAKQRPVFKNSKGRTFVKSNGKKVYVKKLFTPKTAFFTPKEIPKVPTEVVPSSNLTPGSKETGKVNAKSRKVFKNSKDRTYVVKADGKRVYVKKLFTPKASSPKAAPKEIVMSDITPGSKETGKVNAKKRKVLKNAKNRTYVKEGGKKVYVKKLFTPK
jgi:hypothetical protein